MKHALIIRRAALIAAGGVVLSIPALLNGFPFIFLDSGDYLIFTPHLFRSPYYGLFIYFFHLNHFIWAPVFAQGILAAGLIWLMIDLHVSRRTEAWFAALLLFLAVFSSLPCFTGFIMADIFTPLMFVLIYMIAFHAEKFSRLLLLFLLLIACVATAAHISNLTMAVAIMPLVLLLLTWCGAPLRRVTQRIGLLLIPTALTAVAVLLFNGIVFGQLSLAPAGQSFLMANLIEGGPARTYLHESCPQAGYKICAQLDELPATTDAFLWSSGLFQKLDGFEGMAQESAAIVRGTIQNYPGAVTRMVVNNFLAGLRTHEPAAEFRSKNKIGPVVELIREKFGNAEAGAYARSAEMRDTIPHDFIRKIDMIFVPIMFVLVVLGGLVAAWRGKRKTAALAVLIVAAVLGNTLLCTAVSGVHDRYQARVTWLLPMAAFFVLYSLRKPDVPSNPETPPCAS